MKKYMLQTLIPLIKVYVVDNAYFYEEVLLFKGFFSPIKFLISALKTFKLLFKRNSYKKL